MCDVLVLAILASVDFLVVFYAAAATGRARFPLERVSRLKQGALYLSERVNLERVDS